jgi:hypothetical protein
MSKQEPSTFEILGSLVTTIIVLVLWAALAIASVAVPVMIAVWVLRIMGVI